MEYFTVAVYMYCGEFELHVLACSTVWTKYNGYRNIEQFLGSRIAKEACW